MKKSAFTAGFFVSLFLSVFLTGIIIFWMIAFLEINQYNAFLPVLTFAIVNLFALVVVMGCGKMILGSIGIPAYASVVFATVVYTAIQFGFMALQFKMKEGIATYVLVQLILLFIYCAVVMPVAINGSRAHNRI